MVELFLKIFSQINLIIFLFVIFFFILTFYWGRIFKFFRLKKYSEKQRFHKNEISRFGGVLIVFFIFFSNLIFIKNSLLNSILFCSLPIIFIGVKEDLFHNTNPFIRLCFMSTSCVLFLIFFQKNFPLIDLPFLNSLFQNQYVNIIFFTFCILIIINGSNLIDGVNGNLNFTTIVQLSSLFFLSYHFEYFELSELLVLLLIAYVIFLIFNYPFGKIFMGDTGAYFIGFLVSILTINLYSSFNELPSWGAVLLLFYPATELLFSFIRKKIFENKNPMSPDIKHLHSIIYRFLIRKYKKNRNYLVTLILFPFWLSPLIIIKIFDDLFFIILSITFLSTLYVLFYVFFYKILINKL